MKIYVCARLGRRDEALRFAKWVELYSDGWEVAAGWLRGPRRDDAECGEDELAAVALRAREEIRAAHAVVAFTEGPEPVAGGQRGGRHVELGMALAWGKPVYVVGPAENIFYRMPEVVRVEKYRQVIDCLRVDRPGTGR